ncbi:unnamed protein product [Cochlearia groenlandica]
MLSHKCVELFGYKGYKLPANARAPRSARKRRSSFTKKIGEDEETCPMELLATVAEKFPFMLSTEKSINGTGDDCVATQTSVKEEFPVEEKPVKPVTLSEEDPYQGSLSPCGFSSVINGGKVEDDAEGYSNFVGIDSKVGINGDAVVVDVRPNVVVSLGSNSRTEAPLMGSGSSHGVRDDVDMFSRDDDENFSGYVHPRVTKKSPRTVPRIGDRRIKKILASRHWKGGSSHAGDANSRRNNYLQHQRNYPIKKRTYSYHGSDLVSDDYRLRTKVHRGSRTVRSMKGQGASFVSSGSHGNKAVSLFGNHLLSLLVYENDVCLREKAFSEFLSFISVRLRIKSFRVPELFVEIPETATVGSLKATYPVSSFHYSFFLASFDSVYKFLFLLLQQRMVMEAVSSLLSDGHRVGLMVQGKKVRDDNKTLYQTGISQDNTHFDSLDFSLEPTSETTHLFASNSSGHGCCEELPIHHTSNILESVHDSALFSSDSFGSENATDDSKPLVPVAFTELSPRPVCLKSKRSEQQKQAAQRRIRRPFSVAEVEALVEAVEKIGTGRWRDVKLCAFEDADHRTYVDLKDKWKTLVHTANISPHQRRGEPVP